MAGFDLRHGRAQLRRDVTELDISSSLGIDNPSYTILH